MSIKYDLLFSDRVFKNSLKNKFNLQEVEKYYLTIDNIGKYNFFYNTIRDYIGNKTSNTLDLAKFFLKKGDLKIALICLLKLFKQEKSNANINYNLAILYYRIKKFRLSFKYFSKLNSGEIDIERFYLDKSFLLSILKEKQLAKDQIYEVLKKNSKNFQAVLDLSKLGSDEDLKFIAKNYNEEKLSQNDLNDQNIDALYFALSYVYEKNKDFKRSFDLLKKANTERHKKVFFNPNKIVNEINFFQKNKNLWNIGANDYLINSVEMIKKHKLIHIFIIGLPRSGSTLIEQMLAAHPKFRTYGEIDVFSRYFKFFFTKTNMKYINEDPDEIKNYSFFYNSQFTVSKNIPFIINKMPFNFYSLGFIKKCLPNSIIIYSKRNYKEIAFSLLKNYFSDLKMNFCYSEENIINYLDIFHKTMSKWKEILKENAYYEVDYESLVSNPIVLKKFFEKYNIEWHSDVLNYYKKNNLTDTSSINQVDKKIYTESMHLNSSIEKQNLDFFKKVDAISLN